MTLIVENNDTENLIEVKNLKINFDTYAGKVKAIRDVSFHLKKGETLAIVGESGSGKSVTTRSLMGLNADNAEIAGGQIMFHGEDVLKKSEKEMQQIRGKDIAMIFQDPMTSLDPTMKIGRQIAEPLIIHNHVSKKQAMAQALEMLKLVGITDAEHRINDYPHQFSGGMRQRIVIAIALICYPEVLIADEPTTALDVTIQAQILKLMKELQEKIETSIIFITHDLGVVAGMADRIAVMYAGKIVEYGTVDEIFYNPQHPYTWGLLNSMPTLDTQSGELSAIPGTPPDLLDPPKGDAFAARNPYALKIDAEQEPPFFKVSDTHYAATWLLDPRAEKVTPPEAIAKRQAQWAKMHTDDGELVRPATPLNTADNLDDSDRE
ncbi:Oligopeptide transport ATP-binding protein OppD [Furfurilactobacillus rossiae]|uniref:Oligopeptide abc transporter, atp-binding protein n=1 Tax=Furfurilactobacillus rossiae DSM 15814 TaxID=1114972 RepID=A0A0R1RJT4_9LACO|nr:oligopeptide abc transporter, atp-binding protein [Furfurilactobacillus rossiae DSM 15814]QLE62127.1 Oligopeptide transport ATP-binding protein OppD [Furfurilactobacillus rossiae]QLE64844.1 Oligopeptide transport ATP-binding protein OppD [Furfurilactobacillus rossiae]QLE67202.1 Oligopeptide transport ATP-binding protein OppD [Furfurilactobacillus rossiae]QLE69632.1 Oligopeptide transport ATP-binding protein OppD [Furfurilactobacillus rossiae]